MSLSHRCQSCACSRLAHGSAHGCSKQTTFSSFLTGAICALGELHAIVANSLRSTVFEFKVSVVSKEGRKPSSRSWVETNLTRVAQAGSESAAAARIFCYPGSNGKISTYRPRSCDRSIARGHPTSSRPMEACEWCNARPGHPAARGASVGDRASAANIPQSHSGKGCRAGGPGNRPTGRHFG